MMGNTATTAAALPYRYDSSSFSCEWRIWNHEISRHLLQPGQTVFVRPKSAMQPGHRGRLMARCCAAHNDDGNDNGGDDGTPNTNKNSSKWRYIPLGSENSNSDETSSSSAERTVSQKRLLPVISPLSSLSMTKSNNNSTTSPITQATTTTITPNKINKMLVLVTSDTIQFRLLAASQLEASDGVLEIGCSTGETSKLIVQQSNATWWLGLDTSAEMVTRTRAKLASSTISSRCRTRCEQMDSLKDSAAAVALVREHFGGNDGDGHTGGGGGGREQQDGLSVVFMDIGGTRDEAAVLLMLNWVLNAFGKDLRLVVIKSKQVFDGLVVKAREEEVNNQKTGISATGGLVADGPAWFQERLRVAQKMIPKHPLQAPKVFNPDDASQPICRYHNLHKHGCFKGSLRCPYDHSHCHFCLEPGHIAMQCPERK